MNVPHIASKKVSCAATTEISSCAIFCDIYSATHSLASCAISHGGYILRTQAAHFVINVVPLHIQSQITRYHEQGKSEISSA